MTQTTTQATIRLFQNSGVSGPHTILDVPTDRAGQDRVAREWAEGQAGHPWDSLTIEVDGEECRLIDQE